MTDSTDEEREALAVHRQDLTEEERRRALIALIHRQDSDAIAGNRWTVDKFVDAVMALFAAPPADRSE